MKTYVDATKLQEYTTKLVAKLKTIFPGAPLVANTVAGMTDTSKIYVYTGSETGYTAGNWYYWDGTAWTSGGVYNAEAINTDTTLSVSGMAADAKVTGDAIVAAKIAVLGEIAPTYSSSVTYAVGDYVIYNFGLYRCITAITTAESWTSDHWTQVDLTADVADLQSARIKYPIYPHSKYGTNGQLLRTLGDGNTQWVDQGLPTDEQTEEAINTWLNAHPEATTTVQDGSLTQAKFTDELQLKTIKDYVTPEMFGAVGNGTTDDTVAIQNAINNENGRTVYFGNKTYKITQSVYLTANKIINDGTINYTGYDYALVLAPTSNIDGASYNLGRVISPHGSCLLIDSTNAWMQYITFDFNRMSADSQKNAIYVKNVGAKWITETRFLNGRFSKGLNGIYFDNSEQTTDYTFSHWIFDRVGFEGVTNGVNIPNKVSRMAFLNCRAEESISQVVFSRAESSSNKHQITWSGMIANGSFWTSCTNYYVLFQSGFINEGGTLVSLDPVVYYNNMLYGLGYIEGTNSLVSTYGGDTYDEETHIQTIDFKTVFDYSTAGSHLNLRKLVRRYMVSNNTNATEIHVYLDDRMFLKIANSPENSFLLTFTQKPSVPIKIYKPAGTLIYTLSNTGSGTLYPRLKISVSKTVYYIEKLELSFAT